MLSKQAAVIYLCLSLLFAGCGPQPAHRLDTVVLNPGDTWLRDINVASADTQLPHAHVVMRGTRILSVGTDQPQVGAIGVTVIDGSGKYLVPGLIDGHVHLAQVPGMSLERQEGMSTLTAAYFRQLPRSYLYFGFTAVVDLNVIDKKRLDELRAAELAPAIFDCGNGLALANGYPTMYGPPGTRFKLYPNFLYDPRQAAAIPKEYKPDEHTAEAAVERVVAGGGVCVKSYYETGFDPKFGRLPVPTVELMRRVRDASHRHQLPLLLHATSLEAHRFAVEAGVDVVAHGLFNWESATASADTLPTAVTDVLDDERRQGIAFMPTSRALSGLADLFSPMFLEQPALARVVPSDLLSWYHSEDAQSFKKELVPNFESLSEERLKAIFRVPLDKAPWVTAYVIHHGGRIVFGSDTPSAPTYANPPGYNGFLEMRELEAAGVSPKQILAAATVENARLFRLSDYGTIEPGKLASLLVLHDDPLKSTAAFDTIETVILKGRVIPREMLAANRN